MTSAARFLVLLCFALPAIAAAQPLGPADRQYCSRLAYMYIYFLGHGETSPYDDPHRGMTDAQVAAARCDVDTAGSIAVLEKRLRAAKFTLPPRG